MINTTVRCIYDVINIIGVYNRCCAPPDGKEWEKLVFHAVGGVSQLRETSTVSRGT